MSFSCTEYLKPSYLPTDLVISTLTAIKRTAANCVLSIIFALLLFEVEWHDVCNSVRSYRQLYDSQVTVRWGHITAVSLDYMRSLPIWYHGCWPIYLTVRDVVLRFYLRSTILNVTRMSCPILLLVSSYTVGYCRRRSDLPRLFNCYLSWRVFENVVVLFRLVDSRYGVVCWAGLFNYLITNCEYSKIIC